MDNEKQSKIFLIRVKIEYYPEDGVVGADGVRDSLAGFMEEFDEHTTEKTEILYVVEEPGSLKTWQEAEYFKEV